MMKLIIFNVEVTDVKVQHFTVVLNYVQKITKTYREKSCWMESFAIQHTNPL